MNTSIKKTCLFLLTAISLFAFSASYSMNQENNPDLAKRRWKQTYFDYGLPITIIAGGYVTKNKFFALYGAIDLTRKVYDRFTKKEFSSDQETTRKEWLRFFREKLGMIVLSGVCAYIMKYVHRDIGLTSYAKIGNLFTSGFSTLKIEEWGNLAVFMAASGVTFHTLSTLVQHAYKIASGAWWD